MPDVSDQDIVPDVAVAIEHVALRGGGELEVCNLALELGGLVHHVLPAVCHGLQVWNVHES